MQAVYKGYNNGGWCVVLDNGNEIKYIPADNASEALELVKLTPEYKEYKGA